MSSQVLAMSEDCFLCRVGPHVHIYDYAMETCVISCAFATAPKKVVSGCTHLSKKEVWETRKHVHHNVCVCKLFTKLRKLVDQSTIRSK